MIQLLLSHLYIYIYTRMRSKCVWHIKKWLSLPLILNSSAHYRKKGSLQLSMASIVDIYKLGKVLTVMMLRESKENKSRNCKNSQEVEGWTILYISEIVFNLLQNTTLGSSHTSPSGSVNAGNTSVALTRSSAVAFLIISSCNANRLLFRLRWSQNSHIVKSE